MYLAISTEYVQLLVSRMLTAIAMCITEITSSAIISSYFPRSSRATALGIFNMGIYLAYGASNGVMNYINEKIGWRNIYYAQAGACIIWTIFVFLIPQSPMVCYGRENLLFFFFFLSSLPKKN